MSGNTGKRCRGCKKWKPYAGYPSQGSFSWGICKQCVVLRVAAGSVLGISTPFQRNPLTAVQVFHPAQAFLHEEFPR